MKRIVLLMLALSVSFSANAQNLWVYSTNGKVEVFSGGNWSVPVPYQKLNPADSIRTSNGASVSLLDRQHDMLFSVQDQGSHSVESLVRNAQTKSKKQSKELISYLWNSLRGDNNVGAFYRPAGVVYRDDDVNSTIAAAVSSMTTNLPVEFDLLVEETGCLIGEMAKIGNTAVVRVRNHSPFDLFVNIIDVDANGNMAACFPINTAQQMSQLLIPSGSEVVLDSFPIIFSEPRGEDNLILVASPEWFNIDAVVMCVQSGRTTTKKVDVGLFKHRLIVE